jgi:signal transduction histidine kinase
VPLYLGMPPREATSLERTDRFLRSHPRLVGAIVVALMVGVGSLQDGLDGHHWLIVTYALPISLAAYGVGAAAGLATALAASALLVLHAHRLGLGDADVTFIVLSRSLSSLGVAALSALASAAARARDHYLEEQRQTARLRRDLVAAFAHDLRSPLQAIVGYAGILRDEAVEAGGGPASPATPDVLEALDHIQQNARQMNELVGDILSTEQSAAVGAKDVTEFSATQLVAELRSELDVIAAARPVRLTWLVEPGTPPFATDCSKLVSIVRNLVGNALKYGGRCWIRVTIAFDAASGRHRIEVSDTGPGIPPEKLAHLFDRFTRGTAPGHRDGFGLGLFIVRSLTKALGGEVSVESEVGRGSRFSVLIPRSEPSAPRPTAAAPAQPRAASRRASTQ